MMGLSSIKECKSIIYDKYDNVIKSCRNLNSNKDLQLVRQAFKIALRNEINDTESNGAEIIRMLDVTLIITREIGLGRTSIICSMLHKTVEKEQIDGEEVTATFGPKVWQILKV